MKKGNRKSYLLRIDEDLWDSLNEWASQEFRSVNGQIELILKNAVNDRQKKNRKTDADTNPSQRLPPTEIKD